MALDPTKKSPAAGVFLVPFPGALGSTLLREELRVGGTDSSAARRWDFNHIIGLAVLQFPRL